MILNKRKRVVDKNYLNFIRSLPCLICLSEGRTSSSEPHHIPEKGNGGVGIKTDDNRAINLCHEHHLEFHQHGRNTFAEKYGIDYEKTILRLNVIYGVDNDE